MSSLRKNYILSLITQTLTVICPLIVTPFTARRLQADNIGIFSYTESIVFLFGLFALLGSKVHGRREIAYCQGDGKRELQTFAEIFITSGITTAIVTLGYIIFAAMQSLYRLIFYIQIFEMIAFHWDIGWFYEGKENFKSLLYRNMLVKISYIILIFSLIKTPEDLPIYVGLRVGTFLLGGATLLFPVLYQCYKNKIRIKSSALLTHIKKMIPLFIPQIAIQVYTVLDKTMIGIITQSPYQNGCYEAAMKVIRVLMNFVGAAAGVLMPRIASLHVAGRQDEIKEKLFNGVHFIFLITLPTIVGVTFAAPIFMPLFLGNGFDDAVGLLQILSVLLFLIGLSGLFGTGTLLACGKEKKFTTCIIAGAVVNFILNLVLIPIMGAKGAALASVGAEFIITAAMLCCLREMIPFLHFCKGFIKPALAAAVMCGILLAVRQYLHCQAICKLTVIVFTGGITYGVFLLLLQEKLTMDIVVHLKHKFFIK